MSRTVVPVPSVMYLRPNQTDPEVAYELVVESLKTYEARRELEQGESPESSVPAPTFEPQLVAMNRAARHDRPGWFRRLLLASCLVLIAVGVSSVDAHAQTSYPPSPSPTRTIPPEPPTAQTGSDIAGPLILGGSLLVVGGALLYAGRRKSI